MIFSGISVDPAVLLALANNGLTNVNIVTYITPGTYTYTPSANLLFACVECIGGGGGSGTFAPGIYASRGQAGGYAKSYLSAFQIGASQQVTVGAGGNNLYATDGQDTKFGTLVLASGGKAMTTGANGYYTNVGQFILGGATVGVINPNATVSFSAAGSFVGWETYDANPYAGGGGNNGKKGATGLIIITEYIGG